MEKLRILVANGNAAYLEITRKMLKFPHEGSAVDVATTAQECLEKISTGKYDLVLLDSRLSDHDGLDVLAKINRLDQAPPVVVTVEEGREDIIPQALARGAQDYVVKVRGYLTALPFTVRKVLERRKMKLPAFPPKEEKAETPVEPKPENNTAEATTGAEAFFILDRRARFLSASPRVEKLSGYTEEELLELSFIDLLPREKERDFFLWAEDLTQTEQKPFITALIGKRGEVLRVAITLDPLKDDAGEITGYRGRLQLAPESLGETLAVEQRIDQRVMAQAMAQLFYMSCVEPLNVLLHRIAELACQTFRFQRSTVALLDRRKRAFLKQAWVGYSEDGAPHRALEVPQEIVKRLFADRFRVKVIYYDKDRPAAQEETSPILPERRTQPRRPPHQWHKRDLVLLNLTDHARQSFGYVSLDTPVEGYLPTRDTFHNLELFASLASAAIENAYRFSSMERRNRRLKQVLVTSNIFRLDLNLTELLKEVVWSVKFSLDFNLVLLCLISRKTKMLEAKAVACEDKLKLLQLREVRFPLKTFAELLREPYRRGKSYLVTGAEPVLRSLKTLYYGTMSYDRPEEGSWSQQHLLMVPIKSREGKIIGFILVDDPVDYRLPDDETTRTLEILANQIAIAIDNRVRYVQLRKRLEEPSSLEPTMEGSPDLPATEGFDQEVDKLFA